MCNGGWSWRGTLVYRKDVAVVGTLILSQRCCCVVVFGCCCCDVVGCCSFLAADSFACSALLAAASLAARAAISVIHGWSFTCDSGMRSSGTFFSRRPMKSRAPGKKQQLLEVP